MDRRLFLQIMTGVLASARNANAADEIIHLGKRGVDVDYASYLSKHDIVYLSPALEGYEGFPIGNGDMGGMLWTPSGGLSLTLNKCDAWDDRSGFEPGNQTDLVSCGALNIESLPVFDWIYLEDYEARLSLFEACCRIRSKTPFGTTEIESFCSSRSKVFCCHVRDSLTQEVSRKIKLSRWPSRSLDLLITAPGTYSGDASQRLAGVTSGFEGTGVWTQIQLSQMSVAVYCEVDGFEPKMFRESAFVAGIESSAQKKSEYVTYVSIVTSEEAANPLAQARTNVQVARNKGYSSVLSEHKQEWSDFWHRSFLQVSEDYFENLWYFHFYQLNSCSRGRYAPLFSGGLWLWNKDIRQWGGRYYHWNEQGVYWPVHAANHVELAEPYYRTYFPMIEPARAAAKTALGIDGVFFSDIANRKGEQLVSSSSLSCNLTPGMQIALDFWRHYDYTRQQPFLVQQTIPFLEENIRFYLGILKRDSAGNYYVPSSCAYETPGGGDERKLRNATPDIATIRAGFKAYLSGMRVLNRQNDLVKSCKDVLEHLAPFVTYQDPIRGEVFGRGLYPSGKVATDPVFRPDQSPVFPSGEVGLNDRGSKVFETAVRTYRPGERKEIGIWPESVVAARLGLKDAAVKELAVRADQLQIFPQGFFTDMGMRTLQFYAHNKAEGSPVRGWDARPRVGGVSAEKRPVPVKSITQPFLESAGIFSTTLNEMLLQSYDRKIRVFPSLPGDWTARFTLRASGAFMVTSEFIRGDIRYVNIESLVGEECVVVNPWSSVARLRHVASGEVIAEGSLAEFRFNTEPGQIFILERVVKPIESYKRATLKATANQAPKTFGAVILGKIRDF